MDCLNEVPTQTLNPKQSEDHSEASILNTLNQDLQIVDACCTNMIGIFFGALLILAMRLYTLTISCAALSHLFIVMLGFSVATRYAAERFCSCRRYLTRTQAMQNSEVYKGLLQLGSAPPYFLFAYQSVKGRLLHDCYSAIDKHNRISLGQFIITAWFGIRISILGLVMEFLVKTVPFTSAWWFLGGEEGKFTRENENSTGSSTFLSLVVLNTELFTGIVRQLRG